MNLLQRCYIFISNNRMVNNLLILLKADHKMELAARQWKAFSYNTKKTTQENAGFSHTQQVQEAIDKLKQDFTHFVNTSIPKGANVLDLGCGPGIYLELLKDNYRLYGIDVSEDMIAQARKLLPGSILQTGNFLNSQFETKFGLIFSISVLEYVPVSQLRQFFLKCNELLEPGGYIFIQYPHALKKSHLYYPDRNYIHYSPKKITELCSDLFKIVKHEQFYDGRKINRYDNNPYPTPSKDFRNGYLLIAKKKDADN